jgi:D-alanyl-D-alanine carboxypeptidase
LVSAERAALLAGLGITPALLAGRALQAHEEAPELVLAERNAAGREFLLTPAAAAAWWKMRAAALADGQTLILLSAFRSVARQAEIIRAKRAAGQPIEAILRASAPPGFSEHHTGRAVDIGTPAHPELEASFEATPAFDWLCRHALRFGFTLSYPRGNAAGFMAEPWHWCFQGEAQHGI